MNKGVVIQNYAPFSIQFNLEQWKIYQKKNL